MIYREKLNTEGLVSFYFQRIKCFLFGVSFGVSFLLFCLVSWLYLNTFKRQKKGKKRQNLLFGKVKKGKKMMFVVSGGAFPLEDRKKIKSPNKGVFLFSVAGVFSFLNFVLLFSCGWFLCGSVCSVVCECCSLLCGFICFSRAFIVCFVLFIVCLVFKLSRLFYITVLILWGSIYSFIVADHGFIYGYSVLSSEDVLFIAFTGFYSLTVLFIVYHSIKLYAAL